MIRVKNNLIFNKELFDSQPIAIKPKLAAMPTKEQLLIELTALTAKIEALT
jgi:hypothetical protein